MIRVLMAAAAVLALACGRADAACAPRVFEGDSYTVCSFDLATDRIALFNLDADGSPYEDFSSLDEALKAEGKSLAFAMNAGMFDEALKPIGLYVENGKQMKKLNRRNGGGNFHLKPNGVFFVAGDRAGVLDTDAYAKRGARVDFATQSGPMLVIGGQIHPKFSPNGTSAKRRNGVGVVDGHTVRFAISDGFVTFYDFARLFRDELHCDNALFFDGSVSSLYAPELSRNDSLVPLGPIVAVVK
jgi:uncharacterized protein YigE (DUF2233 family)